MIDPEAFGELIRETTGLLRISNKVLAYSCGISPSTLANWRRVGVSQAAAKSPAYRNFEAYMKDFEKKIAYQETGRGTSPVDSEVSRRLVTLYERFKRDSCATPTLPSVEVVEELQETSHFRGENRKEDFLTQFENISVSANLIRWRDRDISREPFDSKIVGMGGVRNKTEIYDELTLFSYNSVIQTQDRNMPVLLRTSGVLEVTNIGNEQFLLDKEVHEQTGGKVLPLQLPISKNHREITFVEKIFNGFQRGNENLAVRVFDNSVTNMLHITVDFSLVLTYNRFLELPTAQYIALGGIGRPVPTSNLMNGSIWYAFLNNPDPGSRLQMSWSLE